jgi:protocatechuate 3,4-dioxygenase beta subunit
MMKTKHSSTRRQSLIMIGAAGTALLGCGGTDEASGQNTGSDGSGGGGSPGAGGGGGVGGGAGGNGGGDTGAGGGGGSLACEPKVETTVGPFPNQDPLERQDIRSNTSGGSARAGAALSLRISVLDLDDNCSPIAGAVVDVWQCDAVGVYSGYSTFGTADDDFLRGYQKTDANGVAEFLTIFPGSYSGRALHIHISMQGQPNNLPPNGSGTSMTNVFVSQLYFHDADADEVFATFPIYQGGATVTPNASDAIFVSGGGQDMLVTMTKDGAGYVGEASIGVHRKDIGM